MRAAQVQDLAGKSQRVKMLKALNHFKCGHIVPNLLRNARTFPVHVANAVLTGSSPGGGLCWAHWLGTSKEESFINFFINTKMDHHQDALLKW